MQTGDVPVSGLVGPEELMEHQSHPDCVDCGFKEGGCLKEKVRCDWQSKGKGCWEKYCSNFRAEKSKSEDTKSRMSGIGWAKWKRKFTQG